MIKQMYFERNITDCNVRESEKRFYELLDEGWKIVIAIPIQSGMSCHTYTRKIHYVLEKEETDDEKEN